MGVALTVIFVLRWCSTMEWLPRKNGKCAKQHPAVAYVNKNYSLMVFICQCVYIKSMYMGKQI